MGPKAMLFFAFPQLKLSTLWQPGNLKKINQVTGDNQTPFFAPTLGFIFKVSEKSVKFFIKKEVLIQIKLLCDRIAPFTQMQITDYDKIEFIWATHGLSCNWLSAI
jgi:hypothetical protein